MTINKSLRRVLVCTFFLSAFSARAGDLFQISAAPGGGTNNSIFVSGSSLIPLVQTLINNQAQFSQLNGQNYSAVLRYASVPNALSFAVVQNGGNLVARITTPFRPGLIDRTFNATSKSDLNNQLTDYLKGNGANDLARLVAAIGENSPAGVLDGNPNAASARSSDLAFNMYAFGPTFTAADEADSGNASTSRVGASVTADGGTFSSQGTRGKNLDLTPVIPIALDSEHRVRLEIAIPLSYVEIDGAEEYGAGIQLALPIVVVKHTKDEPWNWQLTPLGGAVGAGSGDMAAGGLMGEGGLASAATYSWRGWQFSMGNAAVAFEGINFSAGGYNFDSQVSQQIFKNGLKIGRELGAHWYAEIYGIDTEFAQAAFTPRYTTLGGGVGYRGSHGKGYLTLGTYTDIAPHYTAVKFQFGTGWKF